MTKNKSLNDWLATLETKHSKKIDLGLKRINQVYEHIKLEKISPIIITVSGTNGKGSTVAILSSICQQAGYKVGCFTSPHIQRYNERIKINACEVADDEIIDAFIKIDQNLNGISLSYFEYATLAALIIFKKHKVDISILEVGLGGRLDSVNVVDTDCAIITTIDIDHTDWLGDDIESIAFEKAGIMRKVKPAIYGDKNCPKSIVEHAKSIGANLFQVNIAQKISALNIKGEYQIKNARTAITALKTMGNRLLINDDHIKAGLQNIQLEGRLQIIATSPEIMVDVSHNKQAAISLAEWLKNNPVKGQTFAVFAVLKDKLAIDWLHNFSDLIDVWCISEVECERAMPTNKLLKILADLASLTLSFQSVPKAMKAAKIMSKKEDRIIVFGSFYTVSEVMRK